MARLRIRQALTMLKISVKYLQEGKEVCIVSYPNHAYYMIAMYATKRSYSIMCEEKCNCLE